MKNLENGDGRGPLSPSHLRLEELFGGGFIEGSVKSRFVVVPNFWIAEEDLNKT